MVKGMWQTDYVMEDSALVCETGEGLFIITGCSHSGICNIVDYAMEVCGNKKVCGVLGGFHLFETGERLKKTIAYFKQLETAKIYPCHCTSLGVKAAMVHELGAEEVGVGFYIEK